MSIEKITAKILDDAQSQADAVLQEAREKRDAILEAAKAEAAEILAEAERSGGQEREKRMERRKAVAEIDGRKIVLQEKQAKITACFEAAAQKIVDMEPQAYVDFLTALLRETGATEGELIFNERDRAAVGPAVCEAAAKAVKDCRITVSEETRDIRGGFLLRQGAVYINETIEAMIDSAKEELTGEVAARLFP